MRWCGPVSSEGSTDRECSLQLLGVWSDGLRADIAGCCEVDARSFSYVNSYGTTSQLHFRVLWEADRAARQGAFQSGEQSWNREVYKAGNFALNLYLCLNNFLQWPDDPSTWPCDVICFAFHPSQWESAHRPLGSWAVSQGCQHNTEHSPCWAQKSTHSKPDL